MITTQKQLRAAFWKTFPDLICCRDKKGKPERQNLQWTDTRVAWVNYIDSLARNGQISEALAGRATL